MSSMFDSFDSLARPLLESLLNTLWQGMLIAALVWLLLRFIKRLSATTRHAVWLVTLLTIGALPLLGAIANRNIPAPEPAAPAKREPLRPAVETAAPISAPEANQPSEPFSLESGVSSLDQDPPKINYDVRPAQRFSEMRFDDGARASTFEESSGAVAATAPPSSKAQGGTLWLRVKSLAAKAFSGPRRCCCALSGWFSAR